MQNRALIYSKPNIGDGPPELRTNSTFKFCIARVHIWTKEIRCLVLKIQSYGNCAEKRQTNRQLFKRIAAGNECCHSESEDAGERGRERHRNGGNDVSASLFPDVSIRSCPGGTPPSYMMPQTISICFFEHFIEEKSWKDGKLPSCLLFLLYVSFKWSH